MFDKTDVQNTIVIIVVICCCLSFIYNLLNFSFCPAKTILAARQLESTLLTFSLSSNRNHFELLPFIEKFIYAHIKGDKRNFTTKIKYTMIDPEKKKKIPLKI